MTPEEYNFLINESYHLAMLCLQLDRYALDTEFQMVVDSIIAFTQPIILKSPTTSHHKIPE